MTDIVEKLLAAIAADEECAEDLSGDCWLEGDERAITATQRFADRTAILRRCAADRDLVAMYVKAAEKCAEIEAVEKQRGLRQSEHMSAVMADVYRFAYRSALACLARGYGLEETP